MDSLRCNRLTCRRALAEKAVVTTCSHIFCVECANELFNATRLCPACDTSLIEPDDVVVCSLRPSNDYKTSVLSGLNPAIIIEICGRALSFWQYQVHQEHSFQQAVIRNVNEKNAQLQKEFGNVVREANGELSLLNNKVSELERELELERRKASSLQESLKDQEKEYQKLKSHFDRIKRKALLNPNAIAQEGVPLAGGSVGRTAEVISDQNNRLRPGGGLAQGASLLDVGSVVNSMEASGIQRTPIVNRTIPQGPAWRPMNMSAAQSRPSAQRQPFNHMQDRSFRSGSGSGSMDEVENLLSGQPAHHVRRASGWHGQGRPNKAFAPTANQRTNGGFRPAGMMG